MHKYVSTQTVLYITAKGLMEVLTFMLKFSVRCNTISNSINIAERQSSLQDESVILYSWLAYRDSSFQK